MKKKNIKIIAILLFAIFVLNYNTTIIKAYELVGTGCYPSGGGGDSDGDGSGGGGGYGNGGGGGGPACEIGNHTACNIKEETGYEEISLNEDIYDTKGNYLGNSFTIKDNYKFIAGRFVGIDAYEKYLRTFNISIAPTCTRGYDSWEVIGYSSYECGYDVYDMGKYKGHVSQSCSLPVYGYVRRCVPCTPDEEQCRKEAEDKLDKLARSVDLSPSYEAKRQDVNDINKGLDGDNPTLKIDESGKNVDYGETIPLPPTTVGGYYRRFTRTVTMTYTYNLTSAWIDPLTGRVKYENDPNNGLAVNDKDKKTYMKVPEIYATRTGGRVQIGQYFVPLNAKSTDLLRYYLEPDLTRTPLSTLMCTTLIDKYSTRSSDGIYWKDFIANKNDKELLSTRANTAEDAKRIVNAENGCRMALYVDFRIAQGFYNEVSKKKTGTGSGSGNGSGTGPGNSSSIGSGSGINGTGETELIGYNFYYRPIDYSIPFPNGLEENGYWIDTYDQKKNAVTVANAANNKLDLDDSFNQVTYATNKDYDLSTIRNYNKKNKYTSWDGMNISGSSSFIVQGYGVTRQNCQTFYALGCGPSNDDWEACKSRQTGVCRK